MSKIILVLWVLGVMHAAVFSGVDAVGAEHPKQHDFSWAVTAKTVFEQLKQKQKPVLIDIRSSDQFDQVRILSSVNIPLYAVKTKLFLKERDVVFINEGYYYGQLEAECKKLNETGFNVSVLFGGLNAWRKAGGKTEGSLIALQKIKKVSPREFHLEKDYMNHLIIDISKTKDCASSSLTENIIHLPVVDENTLRSSVLDSTSSGSNQQSKLPFKTIVIASNDGMGYENVERIIKKIKMTNVFYLDGGFGAYRQYLNQLSLSRQPKEKRMKQQKKCNDCGT